jgi:hypothetical protein
MIKPLITEEKINNVLGVNKKLDVVIYTLSLNRDPVNVKAQLTTFFSQEKMSETIKGASSCEIWYNSYA